MAGPNCTLLSAEQANSTVEVVKFGFYMFFPIAMMLKFGDPEW